MKTIKCTCTQSFEGVASPVSEMLLHSKTAKFPYHKKFMQVGVDQICMHTKFDGHGLSGFWDFGPFIFPSNEVWTM